MKVLAVFLLTAALAGCPAFEHKAPVASRVDVPGWDHCLLYDVRDLPSGVDPDTHEPDEDLQRAAFVVQWVDRGLYAVAFEDGDHEEPAASSDAGTTTDQPKPPETTVKLGIFESVTAGGEVFLMSRPSREPRSERRNLIGRLSAAANGGRIDVFFENTVSRAAKQAGVETRATSIIGGLFGEEADEDSDGRIQTKSEADTLAVLKNLADADADMTYTFRVQPID